MVKEIRCVHLGKDLENLISLADIRLLEETSTDSLENIKAIK
jgi:hypothetical protein